MIQANETDLRPFGEDCWFRCLFLWTRRFKWPSRACF